MILSAINDVTQRGLTFPWFEVHGSKQSQSCCVPGPSFQGAQCTLLPMPTVLAVIITLSLCHSVCDSNVELGEFDISLPKCVWALNEHWPLLVCSLASAWRRPRQVPGTLEVCCSQGPAWDRGQSRAVAHTQPCLTSSLQASSESTMLLVLLQNNLMGLLLPLSIAPWEKQELEELSLNCSIAFLGSNSLQDSTQKCPEHLPPNCQPIGGSSYCWANDTPLGQQSRRLFAFYCSF